jgi:hypothetical protein
VCLTPSVYCYQTLGKSSLVPAIIQQHLHKKHVDCKDKLMMCFKYKHSQNNLTSAIKGENGKMCEISYKVRYQPILFSVVKSMWLLKISSYFAQLKWFHVYSFCDNHLRLSKALHFQILQFWEKSRNWVAVSNMSSVNKWKAVEVLLCKLMNALILPVFLFCLQLCDTYITIKSEKEMLMCRPLPIHSTGRDILTDLYITEQEVLGRKFAYFPYISHLFVVLQPNLMEINISEFTLTSFNSV